jgi:DNA-3-methyladenine glycosylase
VVDPAGERRLIAGPGKVTQHLKINKKLDGTDVTDSMEMWLEDRGVCIPKKRITKGPRVGVDYAGSYWAARHWRFRITKLIMQAGIREK